MWLRARARRKHIRRNALASGSENLATFEPDGSAFRLIVGKFALATRLTLLTAKIIREREVFLNFALALFFRFFRVHATLRFC